MKAQRVPGERRRQVKEVVGTRRWLLPKTTGMKAAAACPLRLRHALPPQHAMPCVCHLMAGTV